MKKSILISMMLLAAIHVGIAGIGLYNPQDLTGYATEQYVDDNSTTASDLADGITTEASGSQLKVKDYIPNNILLNSFRLQDLGSYAIYDMIDGVSDTFVDEQGIDTATSISEVFTAGYFNMIPTITSYSNAVLGVGKNATVSTFALGALSQGFGQDSNWTFQVWCMPTNTGDAGGVLQFDRNSAGPNYAMRLNWSNAGTYNWYLDDGNANNASWEGGSSQLDNWNHLVCTYSNNLWTIWHSATNVASNSFDTGKEARNSNPVLTLGAEQSGNYSFWGRLDEVVIWNRTLSATEITNLYNGGAGVYADTNISPFLPNEGCIAIYHLDEADGALTFPNSVTHNGTFDLTNSVADPFTFVKGVVDNTNASTAAVFMDLVSSNFTATFVPTDARILLDIEDTSTNVAVLNDNFFAAVSRDGGTSYSTGTLATAQILSTNANRRLIDCAISVTNQPSGSNMVWKVHETNSIPTRIHSAGAYWQ